MQKPDFSEIDRTLMKAIETEDWGLLVLAAAVEQGHVSELKLSALLDLTRGVIAIAGISAAHGLAFAIPALQGWMPFTTGIGFIFVLLMTRRLRRAVLRYLPQQSRRTKFQIETLEKIVSGRSNLDPAE